MLLLTIFHSMSFLSVLLVKYIWNCSVTIDIHFPTFKIKIKTAFQEQVQKFRVAFSVLPELVSIFNVVLIEDEY